MIDVSETNAGDARPVWALGLMSGTSMDGADAALLRTDGESIAAFGPSHALPFEAGGAKATRAFVERLGGDIRTPFRNLFAEWPPSPEALSRHGDTGALAAAEDIVANHAAAVHALCACASVHPEVVGFHGQTVLHAPEEAWTWQMGDGETLANRVGLPVVWDFRSADMAAGGQGAPLAPFFHHALARQIGAERPLAFLNIGGVANVTWVDPALPRPEMPGALVAFDTGPGNALLDDWMQRRTGATVDRDGTMAASGTVHVRAVGNFGQAYLQRLAPKSLDRHDFHGALQTVEDLSTADGAATLTALTAHCVAASVAQMPSPPERWLVCGGGRLNPTMMAMLRADLRAPVDPVEAVGLDGDMLEAQAFAWLAVRVLRGLPTSAPATTGCRQPVSGGQVHYPAANSSSSS